MSKYLEIKTRLDKRIEMYIKFVNNGTGSSDNHLHNKLTLSELIYIRDGKCE